MPAARVCLGCRKRFKPETKTETRCPVCKTKRNREVWDKRMLDPIEHDLRRLRRSPRWQDAVRRCLARDGHRCRGVVRGVPCEATTGLQAHHTTLARELLIEGDDPCDLRYLVTLCVSCHRKADVQLRGSGRR
jgi:hypothetical protein